MSSRNLASLLALTFAAAFLAAPASAQVDTKKDSALFAAGKAQKRHGKRLEARGEHKERVGERMENRGDRKQAKGQRKIRRARKP